MNQMWQCSLPSPHRPTCTLPTPGTASTARWIFSRSGPELGCAVVVEIGEVDVLASLEQDDDGKTARLVERANRPVLVRPEALVVCVLATPAVDTAGAVPRPLGLDGRRQLAHA